MARILEKTRAKEEQEAEEKHQKINEMLGGGLENMRSVVLKPSQLQKNESEKSIHTQDKANKAQTAQKRKVSSFTNSSPSLTHVQFAPSVLYSPIHSWLKRASRS